MGKGGRIQASRQKQNIIETQHKQNKIQMWVITELPSAELIRCQRHFWTLSVTGAAYDWHGMISH